MSEDLVAQWRARANALILETQVHHVALVNAIPGLLLLGRDYRAAQQRYALTHAQDHERRLLQELERRAINLKILMHERYGRAEAAACRTESIAYLDALMMETQIVIACGKTAEVILGFLSSFGRLKKALDKAKLQIDLFKAHQPAVVGLSSGAATGGDGAVTAGQVGALVLRTHKKTEDLGKSLWNIAGLCNRARTVEDFYTVVALLAHAVKSATELVANFPVREVARQKLKHVSNVAGVIRDAEDALRALRGAWHSLERIIGGIRSMDRERAEGRRYLGTGRHVLGDCLKQKPLQDWDLGDITYSAFDASSAAILADDARRRADRLAADMAAAELMYRHQTARLRAALKPVRAHLVATEECLQRLTLQIADLGWAASGYPSKAAAVQKIVEQLTGYRASVNRTYVNLQFLTVPSE